MERVWCLCLALAIAACGPVSAVATSASQIVVQDGDSFRIGDTRIRLFGIDAPERDQTCTAPRGQTWACGTWATARLTRLVRNQPVQCTDLGADRYGRRISRCMVNGQDIAAQMVSEGAATAYRKYSSDYVIHELEARAAGRGIWATGPQTSPEAHRHAAKPLAGGNRPAPVAAQGGCRIKGNISASGRIYHRPGQKYYDETQVSPAKGEAWFCTTAEAQAAGFRASKR